MGAYISTARSLDKDLRSFEEEVQSLSRTTPFEDARYLPTLGTGLQVLLHRGPHPDTQEWRDAISYARTVIVSPKDDKSRLTSVWKRSSSDIARELMGRYGPSTLKAAREGCERIISENFGGDKQKVPHVDKRANFLRNFRDHKVGKSFYPPSSTLAILGYEVCIVSTSIAMLAWAPPNIASKLGNLAMLALCEDYAGFTESDYKVRLRLLALTMGVACEVDGWAPEALVDASLIQSPGQGNDLSVKSALAWRAISGGATAFSGYLLGVGSIEEGTITPQVLMGVHDMFDFRSDCAAGNYETSVMVACGLRVENPFHACIEALLDLVCTNPAKTLYTVTGVTVLNYTGARYGSYEYRGTHAPPCQSCTERLREASLQAGFAWAPEVPPRSFAEGDETREELKDMVDNYRDAGVARKGVAWFQYLVSTGEIFLFDALADGVGAVDRGAGWA